MVLSDRTRNTMFTLLGAAGLVLKRQIASILPDVVLSHGGNVTASFSVYFIARLLVAPVRLNRATSVGVALLVVELFEATNGFGVMENTYDPLDFVANALAIALALAVDVTASRVARRRSRSIGPTGPDATRRPDAA
jgi:uncharacterized protein involved in response to NO